MSSKVNDTMRTTRRDFLRTTMGGAAAVALGAPLLVGCGSRSGNLGHSVLTTKVKPTRMLLSTFLLGTVESFDPETFKSQGTFAPSRGITVTTAGIVGGPDNNVFVFSPGGDAVFMYDKTTAILKRTLPTPAKGLITPHNGVIGPDGNLYVVNAPTLNANIGKGIDTIERYDSRTGDRLGTFAEVRAPFGITVNPNDLDFYVSSTLQYTTFTNETDYVTRLNGQNGVFQGTVVRNIKVPFTMAFHPSGDLLVVEHFAGTIGRYDVSTGRLVGTFASCPFPVGITYGPDGDLYVASFTTPDRYAAILTGNLLGALGGGSVLRFDGITGAPKGTVLSGLPLAGFIAFV